MSNIPVQNTNMLSASRAVVRKTGPVVGYYQDGDDTPSEEHVS